MTSNRRVLQPADSVASDPDNPPGALEPWSRLLHLASCRHGAFSRMAAKDCGVSAKMLRTAIELGRIEQVYPNAFRVAGSTASWDQRVAIACDALGHSAVASRRTASALNRFPGFGRDVIEVTSDQHRTQRLQGVVAHSTSRWLPEDLVVIDGVRCTDPIRTFIDLGADLSRARHEELLDSLEHSGQIERSDLEDRLARIRVQGRNGVGYTARLLEGRAASALLPTNAFERQFLRLIERSGLPSPQCQVRFRLRDGFVAIVDFLWCDLLFGVEADGHGAHATRSARAHDNRRASRLLELGIELVRFTWEQVRYEPAMVVGSVERHLRRRRAMIARGQLSISADYQDALVDRRAS